MIQIAVAAIALIIAFGSGWSVRGWKEDAARLEAERDAQETYKLTVEGWSAAVQVVTGQRESERQQAAADRRDFEKEKADAQRRGTMLCGPGLAPPGLAVDRGAGAWLHPDAVRLWNHALGIGLPGALGPWRPDGAGPPADPAAITRP